MLIPVLGRELSSVTFETIEEQLFQFAQYLSGQPDRHCVVKLVSKLPVQAVTLTVKPARTTEEWVEIWATATVEALPFAVRMEDALRRIADRHLQMRPGSWKRMANPPRQQSRSASRRFRSRGRGAGREPSGAGVIDWSRTCLPQLRAPIASAFKTATCKSFVDFLKRGS